ncbi:hypothetical protein H696_06357, partial [Fonticula alba]
MALAPGDGPFVGMELPQFFGVSVVEVGSPTCESPGTEITGEEADIEGLLRVRASPSPLSKCPRCWLHVVQEAGSVCCRCTGALASAAAAEAEAAAQHLSSLYFEAAKDRLYADAIPSLSRRSVQTVLFHILHSVTRVLAPITVHGSEELFDHYRRHVPNAPESVALLGWPELPAEWRLAEDAPLLRDFSQLAKLRLATNRALEQERRDRRIGSGLEARLTLDPAPGSELARILDTYLDAAGCYNAKAPAALVGLPVIGAGSGSVIDDLTARGLLLRTSEHRHRYPFDWRAKKPVIMRATEQWFCRVSDLTSKALEQLQTVNMVPPS